MYGCMYVYSYVYVMSHMNSVGVSEVYEGAMSKQLSMVCACILILIIIHLYKYIHMK
jgi:hypothetical protein